MKLFEMLKAVRAFENKSLPLLKTLVDFDIVIEIGHAEEQGDPLTMKRLFLLKIASHSTVRRRITALIMQGIIIKTRQAVDQRSSVFAIAPASYALMHKYGTALMEISGTMVLEELKRTAA